MPNEQTEKALDEITQWARELAAGGSPDGGVNITFAIARQGSHTITNAFLTEGDCTPFVPSGKRGTLHNQPPPLAAPLAFFITGTHGVDQVPLAMEADLNTGTVTLKGTFPKSLQRSNTGWSTWSDLRKAALVKVSSSTRNRINPLTRLDT
jgi:hypothetical protein